MATIIDGPWWRGRGAFETIYCQRTDGRSGGRVVARVGSDDVHGLESLAASKLIEAAPELLGLVKRMIDRLGHDETCPSLAVPALACDCILQDAAHVLGGIDV